jgi:hypothetical protein
MTKSQIELLRPYPAFIPSPFHWVCEIAGIGVFLHWHQVLKGLRPLRVDFRMVGLSLFMNYFLSQRLPIWWFVASLSSCSCLSRKVRTASSCCP